MANVIFPSRTWTDIGVVANKPGTITATSPTEGVVYVRVLRAGAVVSEIKTWVGAAPAVRDFLQGDTAMVWCGSLTDQTLNVTIVKP